MFYRTFADDGDNPMNNPNIYNVDRNNRLSLALQQVLAWSTTIGNRKCKRLRKEKEQSRMDTGNIGHNTHKQKKNHRR
jgi:hypothetical protein